MNGKRWLHWIKLLIGLGLTALLYYQINRRESILEALRQTDWVNIGLCLMLLVLNISLAFWKWRYLLKNRFGNVANREVFGSLLFGYTMGLVTPGRLGELARGLFFQDKNRLVVTGLNLLDKAANQIVILTLGGLSLISLTYNFGIWSVEKARPVFTMGGAILVLLWLIVLRPANSRRFLRRLGNRFSPSSKLPALLAAYDNLTIRDSLAVMGLSLIWYLVIIYQYHILVLAFTGVSLLESFQAVSAMLLTKTLLPITFGDLGIREGIAVFFYSAFRVSPAAVFNASLLIFLINFLIPAVCGVYYVFQIRELQGRTAAEPAQSAPLEDAEDILPGTYASGE